MRKTPGRPAKPYPEYPLYAHSLGYWSKKTKTGIKHFGRWGRVVNGKLEQLPYEPNWQSALATYRACVHDANTGRIAESVIQPKTQGGGGLTLAELCNRYLNAKLRKLDAGEIQQRTFQESKRITDMLVVRFGAGCLVDQLEPDDFERLRAFIANRCGPVRLGNEITSVKSVFKYAVDNRLIDHTVHYGSEFRKPNKSVMRRHRAQSDKKLFSAREIRMMLDSLAGKEVVIGKRAGKPIRSRLTANVQLRAAIFLGINTGAGNTDVANLQLKHVDLEGRWLNYPRSKTGVDRRIPLWRETTAALQLAINERPEPRSKSDADCVLLTPRRKGDVRSGGTRLVVSRDKSRTDYVSRQVSGLLRALRINGRKALGFYALRHTFATVGLQTGDRDAMKALMGHVESDVLANYDEEGPSDDRLIRVVEHIRAWLFSDGEPSS